MIVNFKNITPEAEETIVEIARVSSSRVDKREDPDKLINYLIKNKHWSPFEHAYMTVEIITSKAIGIQLLRHRSFTFQEFSQRYAKVTSVVPVELRAQAEKNRQSSTDRMGYFYLWPEEDKIVGQWDGETEEGARLASLCSNAVSICMEAYRELINSGVAKECARMVLPMCTETTIHMTGSIRSWIHMLDIRDDGHAQKEAQEIAQKIKSIFISKCPIIAKARGWS